MQTDIPIDWNPILASLVSIVGAVLTALAGYIIQKQNQMAKGLEKNTELTQAAGKEAKQVAAEAKEAAKKVAVAVAVTTKSQSDEIATTVKDVKKEVSDIATQLNGALTRRIDERITLALATHDSRLNKIECDLSQILVAVQRITSGA